MKVPTKKGSLAGRIEARAILDAAAREKGGSITKQRLHALENHEDFPAPVDALEDGQGRPLPVWRRADIEEYAATRSMVGGRRPAAAGADKG